MTLDLGNVQNIAVVTFNGHKFPALWHAPHRVDITPWVKEGQNHLTIEVVNLWPNRLIGDGKVQQNERRTKTNVTKYDAPDAENYMRISGLLGPVSLRLSDNVKID